MQKQPLLFFKNFASTIIIKISPFYKSMLLFQKSLILGMMLVISTFRRMKQEDWNVQFSLDYRVIFCFTKTKTHNLFPSISHAFYIIWIQLDKRKDKEIPVIYCWIILILSKDRLTDCFVLRLMNMRQHIKHTLLKTLYLNITLELKKNMII